MTESNNSGRRINFAIPPSTLAEAPRPFEDAYWRRCLRVLRMVQVLHGKGFQGLRLFPHIYPLAYRIELVPAKEADRTGVMYRDPPPDNELVARHTGADGSDFFGWNDVADLDAHHLAIEFITRFPKLAHASYHFDFAYAGWYATLLAQCEYGYMPYLFAEYEPKSDALRMKCVDDRNADPRIEWFPFPPTASDRRTLEPGSLPERMSEG